MKFSFSKKSNIPKHKKDGRINPHRFMIFFTSSLLLVITIEIIFFTLFFVNSSRELDAEVLPKFDTNTSQIKKIEKSIQKAEEAVSSREGVAPAPEVN
jgi:hypothetical protein